MKRIFAITFLLFFAPSQPVWSDSMVRTSPVWEATFEQRKKWWSFQPVRPGQPPEVANAEWADHPIDRFLYEKIEGKGLIPSGEADKRTLIRRVTFALTGLPPTPEEVREFVKDSSPEAYAKLVDRLLNSTRFGEHWARHWMDLVRFAETHGSEGDPDIPNAWRYRDYLIRALNGDVPWDLLIREHIAGDLLPEPRWNEAEQINESIIGTAQLRLLEHGFNPVDTLDEQVKTVDNQIDVISKAFQGLTTSCARCHDHKFDPVSQRDYYAIYGVLASVRPTQVTIDTPDRLRVHRTELAALKARIKSALAEAWERRAAELSDAGAAELAIPGDDLSARIGELRKEIEAIDRAAAEALLRQRGVTDFGAEVVWPISAWTFDGDARDTVGGLHGELRDGAYVREGRLILEELGPFMQTGAIGREIREKTLEAWVILGDLQQRGGGVMTLESSNGGVFDAIVFGENSARRWMAGSEFYRRSTRRDGADETAEGEVIHLAITYSADNRIAIYRNGMPYLSAYRPSGESASLRTYEAGQARLLFGKRHTGGGNTSFKGEIEEARLYDKALSAEQVKASFVAGPGIVRPLMERVAMTWEQRMDREKLRAQVDELEARLDRVNPVYAEQAQRRAEHGRLRAKWLTVVADVGTERKRTGDDRLAWDLAGNDVHRWFRYGINPPEHRSAPGEFSILPDGEKVVAAILPAGVYSHLLSQKHNGAFASPRFRVESDYISVLAVGGKGARVRLIPDHYPIGQGNIYPQATLNSDRPAWVRLDVSYRKGSMAYLEFATAEEVTSRDRPPPGRDGRSFFGVQRVVFHDGKEISTIVGERETNVVAAVRAWAADTLSDAQSSFLNGLLAADLLPVRSADVPGIADLVSSYRALDAEIPVARRAPGVLEADSFDAPLLFRGEHSKPREAVSRGYLPVTAGAPFSTQQSGRLELANEIASASNPLTARVMVNRVWHHLFGRGLVPTVDNFGLLGDKPSHPELLDYLAARFVEEGWSGKQLIREIVRSRAFRGSSETTVELAHADPENEWVARMALRRLNGEAIRDSLLAVSGRLDETMFGPGANALAEAKAQTRRSVYLTVRRNFLSPFLETFDAPRPSSTLGRRDHTNVPAQSLALLNDPFVIEQSAAWAATLEGIPERAEERVRRMFEQAFARLPSREESTDSLRYLEDASWSDLAQSLFNVKEFIYVR